ncbi:hypothetical protein [Candidatus Nitrosotalea bavarica]|nr:hypothetical protein [Candidatus Nitrosotalea bavarica]
MLQLLQSLFGVGVPRHIFTLLDIMIVLGCTKEDDADAGET